MRVLLTAGGTGGHIMPAVAIAEAIRDMAPQTEILFVGTDRGMEERIARLNNLVFIPIKALGVKGKSLANLGKAVSVNVGAFIKALRIVRDFKPQWVIGTGGYVTGMVVLAGRLMGCSCAIQEQNSMPGLTNRILSRIARRVFLSFPDRTGKFPKAKTLLTGNPLRKGLTSHKRTTSEEYLLILGGSLGAGSINSAAVQALKLLSSEGHPIKAIHQCGSADYQRVADAYARTDLEVEVRAFIDDMASVYRGACLAVSRCGGITLSELSAMGLPAIMIPFPHATDNHQMANAEYVAGKGGGWIIQDSDLTPERLAREIRTRLDDTEGLLNASLHMNRMGLGAGAETIAREILSV